MAIKLFVIFCCIVLARAQSDTKPAFWKGTALDSHIERMKHSCAEDDTIACFQYKALSFLDNVLKGDYFQISHGTEVRRNNYPSNEIAGRSDSNFEASVEDFIKTHDVNFQVPGVGSVTVDSTSLDEQEIDLKLNFGSGRAVEARKKSKLKKIFIPIVVFLLLKAITLVPFALGILGLKAWNGLQLAFFSFIISTGLAIFQLCQKLAADSALSHSHITSAGPWEQAAHYRSFGGAHDLAYNAHAQ